MPTRAELVTDVADWINRQDFGTRIDGWIRLAETDMAELLRARCMITRSTQNIDAPTITMPPEFLEIDAIRDSTSGRLLRLEDHWTGPLARGAQEPVIAYRMVGECIEFLPKPTFAAGQTTFQSVNMTWFAKPPALVDPQDSNVVLERHYACYLFGACRYAAKWALDADRAQQVEQDLTEAIAAANAWKTKTDYSGAPLRSVVRGFG